jgi:hypothetical protein
MPFLTWYTGVMATIPVVVTVDVNQSTAANMIPKLKVHGMAVSDTLGEFVFGHTDESTFAAIQAVPGIKAIERSSTVQLPPPDSKIQ